MASPASPTAPATPPPAFSSPQATPAQQAPNAPSAAGRRPLPPEMVAEALTLPPNGAINGRRLTLLEALSTALDRRRQTEVAHAYWRLAQAIADYHYALQEYAAIQQFRSRPSDAGMLETTRASMVASLHTAEVAAMKAQADLAEAAGMASGSALPLPADAPHVGPYRTYFDQLFAARNAPPRTRLIDRTLPICRRAIDLHATAVHAAEDALEAAIDAYEQAALDFPSVLSAMNQLGTERRALSTAVCQYNHEIADYALSVAGPGVNGAALVGMMIRTGKPSQAAPNASAELTPVPDSLPEVDREVQPASHTAPASTVPSATPQPGRPTLAPPRSAAQSETAPPTSEPSPEIGSTGLDRAAAAPPGAAADPFLRRQQPTLAPRRDPASPVPAELPDTRNAAPLPRSPSSPTSPPQTPTSATPASATDPTAESTPQQQVTPASGQPGSQTARRPIADSTSTTGNATGLYPALVDMPPAIRMKQLSDVLHWDRGTPEDSSQPISLEDCLSVTPVGNRPQVLRAYWLAHQKVGQYHVKRQAADSLVELEPLALELRRGPAGALGMLQVRADMLAREAEAMDARQALVDAQFELTRLVGRSLDTPWLLPSTPPHAGPYLLKLDAQPPAFTQSWAVRRLAATVPVLADGLQSSATAVVNADSARVAAVAACRSGTGAIRTVLACADQQTDQTLAFLAMVTDYNNSIAEYALAALPSGVPANLLVQTLVVK